MNSMFTKILVPVDGSDNSFRALDQALFISKSTGAAITAMHIIESPPTVYVESQKLLNELLDNYRKQSAKILDKCKEIGQRQDVKVDTVIAEGDAAANINGYAEKEAFDLIVIGSRGFGKLKQALLGSVSSKVIQHAKSSVLIVK
jgi:nucleotide-binding universal stress UspA family protein